TVNPKMKMKHHLLTLILFQTSPLPQSKLRPSLTSKIFQVEKESQVVEDDLSAAHQLVLNLSASLQGQLDLQSNASCAELSNGGWKGKGFSQGLLGLAIVPVLVSAGCLFEAQVLVMQLYAVLGQNDTHEYLQDILVLIKRGKERDSSHMSQRHLRAVIFNIHQLAEVGEKDEGKVGRRGQCYGWVRVKGTRLLGQAAEQSKRLCLEEALQTCGSLGFQCAGVTQDGDSGYYHVILRPGSHVVPSFNSESWIQTCKVRSVRWRRNGGPQHQCVNEKEERVYTVVEWIPAVSTLYNLGTAVYYASVSCYDTAKERAIFSTVDLGTDALMAATGGTAGVAGYALGAGLKTGVKAGIKYLLNSMKEEDDLVVNQNSWENGTITVQ
uniref:Apolipoprotein F n=1 Tax=Cyprinus carpio TaxID=7962 RepID=A0A8C2G7R9_CYPCA